MHARMQPIARASGHAILATLLLTCTIKPASAEQTAWEYKYEQDPMTDKPVVQALSQHSNDSGIIAVTVNCTTDNKILLFFDQYDKDGKGLPYIPDGQLGRHFAKQGPYRTLEIRSNGEPARHRLKSYSPGEAMITTYSNRLVAELFHCTVFGFEPRDSRYKCSTPLTTRLGADTGFNPNLQDIAILKGLLYETEWFLYSKQVKIRGIRPGEIIELETDFTPEFQKKCLPHQPKFTAQPG